MPLLKTSYENFQPRKFINRSKEGVSNCQNIKKEQNTYQCPFVKKCSECYVRKQNTMTLHSIFTHAKGKLCLVTHFFTWRFLALPSTSTTVPESTYRLVTAQEILRASVQADEKKYCTVAVLPFPLHNDFFSFCIGHHLPFRVGLVERHIFFAIF